MAALNPRATRLMLGGGVLLLAATSILFPGSPPLYEGLLTNAEPYRYLAPPAGVSSKTPTDYSQTVTLAQGALPALVASTTESPPQAQLFVAAGAFTAAAGSDTAIVAIKPVAPPEVAPATGQLDGNVYRFTVTAASAPLPLAPGGSATIALRGPAGFTDVRMEQFIGGHWQVATTTPLPQPDTFTANVTTLADVALVGNPVSTAPRTVTTAAGGGVSGTLIIGLLSGAILVVAAAFLFWSRARRRRRLRQRSERKPNRR